MDGIPVLDPILNREAVRVFRKRQYFVLRSVYASIVLAAFLATYAEAYGTTVALRGNALGAFGRFADSFFAIFGFTNLTAILLLTPGHVAATLAIEKQRRTLDDLLMTDFAPWKIVVGKWLGRSLTVLLVVLAAVPMLAVVAFFGGIDFGRLAAFTVLSFDCLFVSAAVSIFASAHTKTTRESLALGYLLVGSLLAVPWAWPIAWKTLGEVAQWSGREALVAGLIEGGEAVAPHLWLGQPYDAYRTILAEDGWTGEVTRRIGWVSGLSALVVVFCLGAAIRYLGTVYLASAGGATARKRRISNARVRRRSIPAVGQAPILWKEWYFDRRAGSKWRLRFGPMLAAFAAVIIPVWIGIRLSVSGSFSTVNLNESIAVAGMVVIGVALLMVAIRAANAIGGERDGFTWNSLLVTPLTAREILFGKLLGATKPVLWAVVMMIPTWLFAVHLGALWWGAIPALMVIVGVFGFLIAAVGVHQSLCRATTDRAILGTLAFILFFAMGGHLVLAAPALTPFGVALAASGVDSEGVQRIFLNLLPEAMLYSSAIYPERVAFTAEVVASALFCALTLVCYAGIAALVVSMALQVFSDRTGRTDAGDRRALPSEEIRGIAVVARRSAHPDPPSTERKPSQVTVDADLTKRGSATT